MSKNNRIMLLVVALLVVCYITACSKNEKDTVVGRGTESSSEIESLEPSSKGCKFSVDFANSNEDKVVFKAETSDGKIQDNIDLGDCYISLTIPEQVEIQGKSIQLRK